MNADRSTFSLRTALVGLGRIGFGFHLEQLQRDPRFALVAVCDPLPERIAEAAHSTGLRGYLQLPAMLAAEQPELVVIASPTVFHREQVECAFSAGAHVFCEKPLASTLADFDHMVAAAQQAGRRLIPYQPCRYAPELRAFKDLLARDLLGPVHLIQRARCSYQRRRDWQAFRAHGGGLLNNYGSHCLDELLWLLDGEPIRSVFCQVRRVASSGDAEDVVVAVLTTARDRLLELHISQAAALSGPAWQLFGARGAAQWSESERRLDARYFHASEVPTVSPETGLAAAGRRYESETLSWRTWSEATEARPGYDYYDAVWRHLVRDEPSPVPLDDARTLLTLLDRCRRSAETGLCT